MNGKMKLYSLGANVNIQFAHFTHQTHTQKLCAFQKRQTHDKHWKCVEVNAITGITFKSALTEGLWLVFLFLCSFALLLVCFAHDSQTHNLWFLLNHSDRSHSKNIYWIRLNYIFYLQSKKRFASLLYFDWIDVLKCRKNAKTWMKEIKKNKKTKRYPLKTENIFHKAVFFFHFWNWPQNNSDNNK